MKNAIRYIGMLTMAGLIAVAAVACGDDDGDDAATPTATTAATQADTPVAGGDEASAASISIVAPATGWTADGDRIEVRVAVDGIKLDGTKIGLPAADNPGVGHWHVYVDGAYAGLSVSDVVSLPNDAMPSISAGEHEIKVQLHNTDHTPVLPEATATATINVPTALTYAATTGAPSIEIVEPTDGTTVTDRVEVRVAVHGIVLDGTKIGLPAADNPGVGHWHVYVDGEYAGLSVSDVISLPNDAMPSIAAGPHEVSVQLHNTDHTPLLPEQKDSVNVVFP